MLGPAICLGSFKRAMFIQLLNTAVTRRLVRALGRKDARSLRAACSRSGVMVPFDFAALGLAPASVPDDDEVLLLLEDAANDELALRDVALLRLISACYRNIYIDYMPSYDDIQIEDDVCFHIMRDAIEQLTVYHWDHREERTTRLRIYAASNPFIRDSRNYNSDDERFHKHKESTCPCPVCASIRSTIRQGYASWRAHRGFPSSRIRDPVRGYFRDS